MNVGLFVIAYVLPVAIEVLVTIARKRNVSEITYNARTDSDPSILGKINGALYRLRDRIPNRHKRLAANVCLNGSLRSVAKSELIVNGSEMRNRLVAFLTALAETRDDVRELIGMNNRAEIESADPRKLFAAYEAVNDGAVNVEDYGFYRSTTDNEFRSTTADLFDTVLSRDGNGVYRLKIAKAPEAIAAAQKQIETDEQKRSAEAKAKAERKANAKRNAKAKAKRKRSQK